MGLITRVKQFLLAGWLQKALSRDPSSRQLQLQYMNGQFILYDPKLKTYYRDGYIGNEQVYAIVRWLIRKACRVPFVLYEVKNDTALKTYKNLTGDGLTRESFKNAQIVKRKALVEVAEGHPIAEWLNRPNQYQSSMTEFLEYCYGYKLLAGERFLYRVDGIPSMPPDVFPINPTEITLEHGEGMFEVTGYLFGPEKEEIEPEFMVHSKYFNPLNVTGTDALRGLSPLRAMLGTVQESSEARNQSIKQLSNGGPIGAIYGDTGSQYVMPEQAAVALEEKIAGSWRGGQKRPIVSSAKLGYISFGLSPVELDALESRKFSFRQLCDGYGISAKLFNMSEDATFNNVNEAKKAAIVDAILPEVFSLREDLNKLLSGYLVGKNGKKYYIDCDPSELPEMQEDMKDLVAVYKELYNMSAVWPNEIREAFKFGRDERPELDELMNYPAVSASYTPWPMFQSDQAAAADIASQTDIPQ